MAASSKYASCSSSDDTSSPDVFSRSHPSSSTSESSSSSSSASSSSTLHDDNSIDLECGHAGLIPPGKPGLPTTIILAAAAARPPKALSLSRYLGDFTLGLSDGLTVPFALTAGLSSLGRTDTVIYAGAAELCAGCISMGIGGYLGAKNDVQAAAAAREEKDTAREMKAVASAATVAVVLYDSSSPSGGLGQGGGSHAAVMGADDDDENGVELDEIRVYDPVMRYIAPLGLPSSLAGRILRHFEAEPTAWREVKVRLAEGERRKEVEWLLREKSGRDKDMEDREGEEQEEGVIKSPVMAGLAVATGYFLGGILPLFPYFFVAHVSEGLAWSFGVCLAMLFSFGFVKDWVLKRKTRRSRLARDELWLDGRVIMVESGGAKQRTCLGVLWKDMPKCALEGLAMAGLGGLAAGAAVLCVRLFEGIRVGKE